VSSLLSTLSKLARLYASSPDNSRITIAKVNLTANDVPSEEIYSFPWIKIFPAQDKAGWLPYVSEDYSTESLHHFIEEFGSWKVDLPEISNTMLNVETQGDGDFVDEKTEL
jgi:hypothetical protein